MSKYILKGGSYLASYAHMFPRVPNINYAYMSPQMSNPPAKMTVPLNGPILQQATMTPFGTLMDNPLENSAIATLSPKFAPFEYGNYKGAYLGSELRPIGMGSASNAKERYMRKLSESFSENKPDVSGTPVTKKNMWDVDNKENPTTLTWYDNDGKATSYSGSGILLMVTIPINKKNMPTKTETLLVMVRRNGGPDDNKYMDLGGNLDTDILKNIVKNGYNNNDEVKQKIIENAAKEVYEESRGAFDLSKLKNNVNIYSNKIEVSQNNTYISFVVNIDFTNMPGLNTKDDCTSAIEGAFHNTGTKYNETNDINFIKVEDAMNSINKGNTTVTFNSNTYELLPRIINIIKKLDKTKIPKSVPCTYRTAGLFSTYVL